jgi:hypothetical protein
MVATHCPGAEDSRMALVAAVSSSSWSCTAAARGGGGRQHARTADVAATRTATATSIERRSSRRIDAHGIATPPARTAAPGHHVLGAKMSAENQSATTAPSAAAAPIRSRTPIPRRARPVRARDLTTLDAPSDPTGRRLQAGDPTIGEAETAAETPRRSEANELSRPRTANCPEPVGQRHRRLGTNVRVDRSSSPPLSHADRCRW